MSGVGRGRGRSCWADSCGEASSWAKAQWWEGTWHIWGAAEPARPHSCWALGVPSGGARVGGAPISGGKWEPVEESGGGGRSASRWGGEATPVTELED